jgi:predicted PurR-regulated permease PerM
MSPVQVAIARCEFGAHRPAVVFGLIPLSLVGVTMLLAGRDWTDLAVAFGLWLAIQAGEKFFLQPFLLGRPLGLRAIPVFVVVLLPGNFFFGPVGFVLPVPVLAVANVCCGTFDLEI